MNKHTLSRAWFLPVAVLLTAMLWASSASALSMLTSSLDFGARGSNVTSLQQFLAADVSVYPEGLVTGYYGSLTRAAVQRYQCKQGIVCTGNAASTGYGRVGPRTLAAINASIGGVSTGGDVSAPIMSTVLSSTSSSAATFTWTTNEPARGIVFYGTSAMPMTEGTPGTPAAVGGTAVAESAFGYNHSLSVTGLSANTNYYFVARSEDASGNVQITWPAVVRTTN